MGHCRLDARFACLRHAASAVAVAVIVLVLSSPADAEIFVLFTVDVETTHRTSVEMDVWGRLPGVEGEHGIGRMMDIFDRHGARGTFLVNAYAAARDGEEAWAEVCRAIHERGHDVELHSHPRAMFDFYEIKQGDLETQTRILVRGCDLIEAWTGVRPLAHRAGAFGANATTLAACRRAGLAVDLSYDPIAADCELEGIVRETDAPSILDGLLCVPVTTYAQAELGSWRSLRFLDIESSSPEEIRAVIGDLRARGVKTAVVMMHSFSFTRDDKVNRRVEMVLDKVLADLSADGDARIVTARELVELWRRDPQRLVGPDFVPTTGWWMTWRRAWQRLGEGPMNALVAFGPLVLLSIVGAVPAWRLWRRSTRRRRDNSVKTPPAV